MAYNTSPPPALFFTINLLIFALTTSHVSCNGLIPDLPYPGTTTPTLPVPTPTLPVPNVPNLPNIPNLPPLGAVCPINALKLSVCANVLGGLLNVVLGGGVVKAPCCSLIAGLVDLDAAVCLCTAIRANVLGINLNVPLSLSLLLNDCGKNLPLGFVCL